MLTTSLVIILFTSFMIWHDDPIELNVEALQSVDSLIKSNGIIEKFLEQIDGSGGFYSIGPVQKTSWPVSVQRACYVDPLVANRQFQATSEAYSEPLEVIRYRSKQDFCLVLLEYERSKRNLLADLDFSSQTVIKEPPVAISLKLFMALAIGLPGLLLIRKVK